MNQMNRVTTTLLALLVVPMILSAQKSADWTHLPEPFGGNPVSLLEIDEGILLSTESNGLFLSTDEGITWEQYGAFEGGPIVIGVLGDGALWGISDDDGGSFRLTDRATNFELANDGLSGRVVIGVVAENDSAYVVTDEGVFISSDNARSWRKFDLDIGGVEEFVSVATRGDRVVIAGEGRAWMTEDFGASFGEFTAAIPSSITGAAWTKSGDLLVSTTDGIYRSVGGTSPFGLFALEGEASMLVGFVTEDRDGDLYLSLANGNLYRVSADGTREERLPIPTRYTFYILAMESSGAILLADNNTGLWRAEDRDASFELVGLVHGGATGRLLTGTAGELIASIHHGVAVSRDQGDTWEYRHVTIPVQSQGGSYEDLNLYRVLTDGTILAIGEAGSVVRWLPDGATVVGGGFITDWVFDVVQTSATSLMAFGWDVSYRSTDLGDSWEEIELRGRGATVDAAGRLWVLAEDGFSGLTVLRFSEDGGKTFSTANSDVENVVSIARLPEGGILVARYTDIGQQHQISLDNGATWRSVDLPCADDYIGVVEVPGGSGLILNTHCGLYNWDPATHAWRSVPVALPEDRYAYTVAHTGSHLVIATEDGLYRVEEQSMSVTPRPGPVVGLELAARRRGDALQVSLASESSRSVDLRLYSLDGKELASTSDVRLGVGRTVQSLPLPEGVATGHYLLVASTTDGGVVSVVCEIAGGE